MRTRPRFVHTATLVVASLVLVLAWVSSASGSAGRAMKLGRHNCSGTANNAKCSGNQATTSLNWDTTFGSVPATGGFVAQGDPAIMGVTNPEYRIDPHEIVAVEGYGSDWGGYFLGVDGGVAATNIGDGGFGVSGTGTVGVQADGREVGVDATGPVGVHAAGDVALQAEGAVNFSSAGLVGIPAGQDSKTVTPGLDINPQSKVLATVQSPTGDLDRVIRHDGTDSFTIRLKAVATQTVTVAYFVIS